MPALPENRDHPSSVRQQPLGRVLTVLVLLQPRSNHEPTILRVEYKNDTISTQPSYISDSPTPTDTQKQFNLNHIKEGASNVPRCQEVWSWRIVLPKCRL